MMKKFFDIEIDIPSMTLEEMLRARDEAQHTVDILNCQIRMRKMIEHKHSSHKYHTH